MSTGHKRAEKKDDQKVEPIQKKIEGDGRGKPNRESPKGPSQAEAVVRAKTRIPGITPGSNGAGSLPRCSPNGHGDRLGVESARKNDFADLLSEEQEWDIDRLKPHPKQDYFFPDESEEADAELDADMEANGQRDPGIVLPDGTILAGHRRHKLRKRRGYKTFKVRVFYGDTLQAEALFLSDNRNRRRLPDFQNVRCAVELVNLANRGVYVLPPECDKEPKTRDKIGKLLGYSGRHVDRYLKALKAPKEVQHACDKGFLKLAEVGQVAKLGKKDQQAIAAKIREKGIAEAKAIFKTYFPDKAETQPSAEDVWRGLRFAMNKAAPELQGRVDQVGKLYSWDLEAIEKIEPLLQELKAKAVADIKAAEEDARWDPEELVHGEHNLAVLDEVERDILSTGEDQ